MKKLTVQDIENIREGTEVTFQLDGPMALNSARAISNYARRTRGFNLKTRTDWDNNSFTIIKLPQAKREGVL